MNLTMVGNFFQFFDMHLRKFAKHKVPILRWVFLFYEETFHRMFKVSVPLSQSNEEHGIDLFSL